jgi:hypothetical protein
MEELLEEVEYSSKKREARTSRLDETEGEPANKGSHQGIEGQAGKEIGPNT